MKSLLCTVQAFQVELSSRQAMVDAIREVGEQSSPGEEGAEVKGQVEELTQLWSHVVTLSDLRDARLQQALTLVTLN